MTISINTRNELGDAAELALVWDVETGQIELDWRMPGTISAREHVRREIVWRLPIPNASELDASELRALARDLGPIALDIPRVQALAGQADPHEWLVAIHRIQDRLFVGLRDWADRY